MLLINVYHGGQILKTSHGTDYDIQATCTFSVDETINFRDLKRQIHVGLELLTSQFNISISARINTAPAGSSGFFYSLFGVISDEISQRNKCPTEGHEIIETAIINPPQLRKCQPRNFIMRS
jgi:hypothetical protein